MDDTIYSGLLCSMIISLRLGDGTQLKRLDITVPGGLQMGEIPESKKWKKMCETRHDHWIIDGTGR